MSSRRDWFLLGGSGGRPLPPPPPRPYVCRPGLTFQGLTVTTGKYGTLPWFEPAIGCLEDPGDRAAVYAAKHAAATPYRPLGDTHCIIEFYSPSQSIYPEPGQPYLNVISPDWEADLPGFRARVFEIIVNGFVPIVSFDGDNGDNPVDGYPNALRQLPILVNLFTQAPDLTPYILFARLWDGVFYGSSPANIANFGSVFRQLLPNGYLAIEHASGHIPVGGGSADWALDGPMSTYDTLISEFDYSNSIQPGNTIWQIAGRTVRPYNRPPDQPDWDDPNPPNYFATGSPRGPYFACGFEWEGAYDWVRGWSTSAQEAQRRAYIAGVGYGACTG